MRVLRFKQQKKQFTGQLDTTNHTWAINHYKENGTGTWVKMQTLYQIPLLVKKNHQKKRYVSFGM